MMNLSITFGRAEGFTLIELIVVLVLIGILAGLGGLLMVRPIEGFVSVNRRAALIDSADSALGLIQREVRNALPNSLRIAGGGRVLEFVNVEESGRYRAKPGGPGLTGSDCRLQFNKPDTSFDVINDYDAVTISAGDRLVVSNSTNSGSSANVYAGDNITPSGTVFGLVLNDATCGGEDRMTLNPGFQFPFPSDNQRFFLVSGPIVYLCDTSAGTLTRYQGHPITASQASVDTDAELTAAGASSALAARYVTGCSFEYQSGTTQRGGMLRVLLRVEDQGERVELFHQVHITNSP